jgi:hypothetical protein
MRIAVGCLVVLLALGSGRAAEDPAGHGAHPTQTVVLTKDDVRPARATMNKGDVLVFENHSFYPMGLTFTDPADLKERIRCGLLSPTAEDTRKAPWLLFSWRDGKLAATMPPGRFAGICSLSPGTYTFLTKIEGDVEAAPGGNLPNKGEIVVK